jgi:hypothetical protein
LRPQKQNKKVKIKFNIEGHAITIGGMKNFTLDSTNFQRFQQHLTHMLFLTIFFPTLHPELNNFFYKNFYLKRKLKTYKRNLLKRHECFMAAEMKPFFEDF